MLVRQSRSQRPLYASRKSASLYRWVQPAVLCTLCAWLLWMGVCAGASPQEKKGPSSSRRAIGYYSDAAGFQNKGAYKLAVDEWKKLLDEFPEDPLASKAWHYLGICYTQLEEPDYSQATNAFEKALEDQQLEVREESLINLSWCLFSQARAAKAGSAEQRDGLMQARERLTEFLKGFGDSSYTDQAYFYLGEIEYTLGDAAKSIPYYKKLIDTASMKKSSLRPGAVYALAVACEELQQDAEAIKRYRQFLDEFPEHELAQEVTVRLADMRLKQGSPQQAAELLSGIAKQAGGKMSDYALLRLGYASSTLGKNEEAVGYYTELLKQYPNSKHAGTAALSLGQSLFQSGQYDLAIEKFSQVLPAQDNQAAEAAHWMAITLLRQNKAKEAVELTEKAMQWSQNSPSEVSLQMDYADALYAIPTELDKAREAYARIVTEHPTDALAPRAAYNAAFAALQGGNLPEARRWSELFLNRFPQDPLRNDVAAVAAEALLQQGEHKAAALAYEKLRQADSENPAFDQWTLRLGMANYLAGDYQAAIDLLNQQVGQLTQDRQRAEAQFVLGASYLYQENFKAAIEQLEASHQTSAAWSSADEVLLLLSEAHQRNKDNDAARRTLETLLKTFPNSRLRAQVEYKLAQLSAASNQFDQAITRYQSIVENQESAGYHNFATYGIAWCLMQKEDYAQALQRLQPLLELRLNDSIGQEAKLAEGVCLRKTDKVKQSIESLTAYLASKPTGNSLANGLYEIGLAHTQQGEIAAANAYFNRIVSEVPEYAALDKVLYELAWNYQESEQPADAAEMFEQLAKRFPNSEYSAEAGYMQAQNLYEAKDYARAADIYTSVLQRGSDPELLEKSQYKLGWSLFQQGRYPQAAKQFAEQAERYRSGPLAVDGLFMQAECDFKQDQYEQALPGYVAAREMLESTTSTNASEQVKSLIYLHGAQCYRELASWNECESWLQVITKNYPKSPYLWTAIYELGYCKQKQDLATEALQYYSQVVENNRNEIGARARFMMGEVYFSQRDFRRAIEEFTRVAYGFGGDRAPEEIKNWQAKSAYEAARCYEVLAPDLRGESRTKAVDGALKFYEDIVRDHAQHELAKQASTRLGELQKLR